VQFDFLFFKKSGLTPEVLIVQKSIQFLANKTLNRLELSEIIKRKKLANN